MKKVVQLTGIFAFMMLIGGNASGQQNEFKGAHLTYSCLGGDQYEVTLKSERIKHLRIESLDIKWFAQKSLNSGSIHFLS